MNKKIIQNAKNIKYFGEMKGLIYFYPEYFQCLPIKFRNIRKIVTECMKIDGMQLKYCPAFHGDKEIMARAMHKSPEAYQFASDEVKKDKNLIFKVITNNLGKLVNYNVSAELQNDKQFVMKLIKHNCYHPCYVSTELQNDKDIIDKVICKHISHDGQLLIDKYNDYIHIKKYVLLAVKQNGLLIQHFHEFQNDREVVLRAIKSSPQILTYIVPNKQNNKLISPKTIARWDTKFISDEFVKEFKTHGKILDVDDK